MIEAIMFTAIGFLGASLVLLIFVPLVHNRAVRLTKRRIEDSLPISNNEMAANRDLMRAEFAMATRRMEMAIEKLKDKNTLQLVALSKTQDTASRLEIENKILRHRARVAEEDIASKTKALSEVEAALSIKGPELERLTSELHEKSAQANTKTVEIVALQTQIETLKERLTTADCLLNAAEQRRTAEHTKLEATTQKLVGEQNKFEVFFCRVSEIEQRLVARTSEDKMQFNQIQQDLENRLTVQTRLLKERERELQVLWRELDLARKAEAELRGEIIAGDDRANSVLQDFQTEKDKLQAMLGRAQSECARLSYELNSLKRLAKDTRAA